MEQWVSWASSKPDERFDEVAGQTEVEYGITNRLQLALYANYSRTKIVPKGPRAPDGSVDMTRFNGFSAEAIYQLLDPDTDPFGFALYLEPAMRAGERVLEGKLLFQKNFLDDRLVFAGNVNLEYVFVRDVAAGTWDHQTALELYLGASYRFAAGWFGGRRAPEREQLCRPSRLCARARRNERVLFRPRAPLRGAEMVGDACGL